MKLVCIFYLHNEIIHTDAFTKPCNASLQTLNFVSKCPEDKVETASKQKNCTAFNTHGKNCQPLQYHCVLSDDLKHIVEVCAPSINIIDHACAMFNREYKSIMRIDSLSCKNFEQKCPWSYNSTNAFQYHKCYPTPDLDHTTLVNLNTTETATRKYVENQRLQVGEIVISSVVTLCVVFIGITVLLLLRRFRLMKKKKERNEQNKAGDKLLPLYHTQNKGGAEIIRRVVVAEVEGLRHLVLSPPNMFWISYGREIILIDINGKKIRVIPRLKYTFGAHSITKEGRLLYLNGSSVKRLSDDSVSEILFTISEENSWNTRCIYSSNNTGKIIIGLHNKDANLGKLHLYSINGKLEQTIENDNDGKPLFKWPRYITENYNADIVTSDWKIGIIVTDVFGNHRFTYPLTCARAVVTDSQGRIYVCNRSPQIYIIDKAGNLLTNILTNTEDIFSLYLINDSELYAGCDSNKTILVYDVQHLDLNQSTTF